jgi:hypothetical protein
LKVLEFGKKKNGVLELESRVLEIGRTKKLKPTPEKPPNQFFYSFKTKKTGGSLHPQGRSAQH